jgi:HEAT repeats
VKLKSNLPNVKRVHVRLRNGLLSVEAKAGTWRQVLNEITEQTGIRFHYALTLEGSVTLSFANLPVRQAIERLFGSEADFVFRYHAMANSPASFPKEVWVLGNVRDGSAGGQQIMHLESWHTYKFAVTAEPPVEKELINHFLAMSRDENPHIRLQAITALTDSGTSDQDGSIVSILDAAMTDENSSVRAYAVQALAIRGEPEVIGHLWRALRDSSAEVRIMAVENAKSQDQGIALFQEALSDVDETIRSIATTRLNQELRRVATK